jgi:hypothetical protein
MGCSTLAQEQSSNCHLNTFWWTILWELCMAFHFSTQLEEGGPMGAQEGKFLPFLHTKMHYPGVREQRKKPEHIVSYMCGHWVHNEH